MGPGGQKLKGQVEALQLNTQGLLELLGSGDPEKRWTFWEKLKGITSRADMLLVEHNVEVANQLLTQVKSSLNTLTNVAKEIGGSGAAAAR
jgi:hypothetical protein